MHLHYFKSIKTLDKLKKERNKLMKEFHPDVNKNSNDLAKVQEINCEYDFLYDKIEKGESPKTTPPPNNEFLKKQAQSIFYALTNVNGVDATLLCQTLSNVPDNQYKALATVYLKEHGVDLLDHISKQVKNKKLKETIAFTVRAAMGDLTVLEVFTYFKNVL
ncbi:MAG: hypothetical protein Q7W13_13105 [Bacteroidia bacterium]|nr:hypothetical protein [Bacteroidia bacterium]